MSTGSFLAMASPYEDTLIDSYMPQTDNQSRVITQADNPFENERNVAEPELKGLPDPAVGGRGGSAHRNGFSVGFFPRRQRARAFDGAIIKGQAVRANPVQGNVGAQNNHGGKLWAGVKNQLADYQASAVETAGTYVGKVGLKTNG